MKIYYSTLNKFILWYLTIYEIGILLFLTIFNYFYINHFYFTFKGLNHMESTNSSKHFLKEKMKWDTVKWCLTVMVILKGKYSQKCNKFWIWTVWTQILPIWIKLNANVSVFRKRYHNSCKNIMLLQMIYSNNSKNLT